MPSGSKRGKNRVKTGPRRLVLVGYKISKALRSTGHERVPGVRSTLGKRACRLAGGPPAQLVGLPHDHRHFAQPRMRRAAMRYERRPREGGGWARERVGQGEGVNGRS